jgi:hypothetical protein
MNLVLLTMDRNKWLALVNTTKQLQVWILEYFMTGSQK